MDFLVRALELEPGDGVLDLGCGEGRHTLELRRRGFAAVGLDRDRRALQRARRVAEELGWRGPWLEADLCQLGAVKRPPQPLGVGVRRSGVAVGEAVPPAAPRYPAAFQLFGPFSRQGGAARDLALLRGVAGLLEDGGRYAFDGVNREWLLGRFSPQGRWRAGGALFQEERRLDRGRTCLYTRTLRVWPDGRREEWEDRVRLYSLEELEGLLRRAGLALEGLWGDFDFRPPGHGLRLVGVAVKRSQS